MDERDLAVRLQQGDLTALDGLYERYARLALRTAYLITRSHSAAEDAVQEAFVQVIRHATKLRDPGAFKPWLFQIVVNEARRHIRRNLLRLLPLDLHTHDRADPTTPLPDEVAESAEELERVALAVDQLPDNQRIPLVLRYQTDLSDEEIAQVLGIPTGTVKSRLHHGRLKVQQRLSRTTWWRPIGHRMPATNTAGEE